jgi:hypothetical protein
MKISKLILINLFFLPFLVGATASTTEDQIIVEQLVDNSCNENGLCEAHLNETFFTCPHDCHHGNIDPAVLQTGLEAQDGPIGIFNINISTVDGVTTITWLTNKPTDTTLVLESGAGETEDGYGMGGTEGGYLDEIYMHEHTVTIDNLDPYRTYYFKIFAKGIYGDNNYDNAQLYAITPAEREILDDQDDTATSTDYESFKDRGGQTFIVKSGDEHWGIGNRILPPTDDLGDEKDFVASSEETEKGFLVRFLLERDDWCLQILILIGIITFLYLHSRVRGSRI